MRLFKRLRRKLYYLSDQQIAQIYEAFLTALEAHRDQVRQTGEPYITHPVSVACILADMKMDASTIMAALLHDVIEDTGIGSAGRKFSQNGVGDGARYSRHYRETCRSFA